MTISGGSTALPEDDSRPHGASEAEAHAAEDKKQKEEVEVRNQADSLVYSTEQTLNELGDKVNADLKGKTEAAIADAKKALEGSDIEAIKLLQRGAAVCGLRAGTDRLRRRSAGKRRVRRCRRCWR